MNDPSVSRSPNLSAPPSSPYIDLPSPTEKIPRTQKLISPPRRSRNGGVRPGLGRPSKKKCTDDLEKVNDAIEKLEREHGADFQAASGVAMLAKGAIRTSVHQLTSEYRILRALSWVALQLVTKKIKPKVATSFTYICNAAIRILELRGHKDAKENLIVRFALKTKGSHKHPKPEAAVADAIAGDAADDRATDAPAAAVSSAAFAVADPAAQVEREIEISGSPERVRETVRQLGGAAAEEKILAQKNLEES